MLLATTFPGEPEQRLRDLVSRHIQDVVDKDWPAMAGDHANLKFTPPNMAEALRVSLALDPQTPGQTIAQREMVGAIENALDARRQRIILSHSSINWVKWTALLAQAALTLIAIGAELRRFGMHGSGISSPPTLIRRGYPPSPERCHLRKNARGKFQKGQAIGAGATAQGTPRLD